MKQSRAERYETQGNLCSFGITEGLGALIASAGIGEATAGIAADALVGAGGGALVSGVTGGNPLYGALGGGLTGGLLGGLGGAGGVIDSATGLGAAGSDALLAAGAGALTSGVSGGNPLTGAIEGGIGGGITGLVSPGLGGPASAVPGGGSTSAAGTSAPASVPVTGGSSGNFDIGAPSGVGPAGLPSIGTDTSLGYPTSSLTGGNSGGFGTGGASVPTGTSLTTNIPTTGVSVSGGGIGAAPSAGMSVTGDAITALPASGPIAAAGSTGLDSLFSGGSGSGGISKYLGPAVAAGGIGLDLLKGNQAVPGQNQLNTLAAQQLALSQQNEKYLQTGTLPPGVQGGLTQAADRQKAAIRSQYASQGDSGSSAEATDLANVDSAVQAQGAQIAMSLLQTGYSEAGLTDTIYNQIMQQALAQDQQLGSAISNFAIASAGGTPAKATATA